MSNVVADEGSQNIINVLKNTFWNYKDETFISLFEHNSTDFLFHNETKHDNETPFEVNYMTYTQF